MQRIDKLISSQMNLSRKQVHTLIRSGAVIVDGQICKSVDTKFDPQKADISVNGHKLNYKEHIYIMLNKPDGVLSASNDKRAKTVVDLVPTELYRDGLFPAGRLDKDTTGLLIITDDGDFAHNMLSPKKNVYKIYRAKLSGNITDDVIHNFERGVIFADGTQCLPAKLWTTSEYGEDVGFVQICEGKFHQVKKMFLACGLTVEKLERLQIGKLKLDNSLKLGECRELTDIELKEIFL